MYSVISLESIDKLVQKDTRDFLILILSRYEVTKEFPYENSSGLSIFQETERKHVEVFLLLIY